MNEAIVFDNLSKDFGSTKALKSISATLLKGTLTGLVGPDGAGKTTLLRLMAGLLAPSAGEVRILGLDPLKQSEELSYDIGYMPQRFGLYEELSVMENLNLYANLRGVFKDKKEATIKRLLEFTKLAPFTKRFAGALSGGMKQKLGLACALMAKPKVLLLDEPSVGVDPLSRRELWQMTEALRGEGMAIVWATAYLDEAEMCQRVILLNEGKIDFDGNPNELSKRLNKRTFYIENIQTDKRSSLFGILKLGTISDAVIEGDKIRVVSKEEQKSDIFESLNATITPTKPRFEDAFIDLLGGNPHTNSPLLTTMPTIEKLSVPPVSCKNLTRKFGSFTACDNVSFEIKQGEIFGLLGPNGAGKSTAFKMLCGLLKPTSGEARVMGLDLRVAGSEAKNSIGYMAQKFSLYFGLSVKQNLEFYAGVYGLEGSKKREAIDEMIETFTLKSYLSSNSSLLPLGYKQRLALACSLMHHPPVLFLDEPTSGVDPITRREFWTHINAIVQKGVSVLVTTHFMEEAEYCDRIALLYKATLIALDTPANLKKNAISPILQNPTMEDAFIHLIKEVDSKELL